MKKTKKTNADDSIDSSFEKERRDEKKRLRLMQESVTNLCNNYNEFLGLMVQLMTVAKPLVEKVIAEYQKEKQPIEMPS